MVIDPAHPDARAALVAYLGEVAARIDGAVVSVDAADDVHEYRPPHGVFVVVRDDAGSVRAAGAVRLLDQATAEIKRMWVSPAARGLGLGSTILGALETQAAALGAGRVVLDTNATLIEAIALYERRGYVRTERYNDNPDATEFFEKALVTKTAPPRTGCGDSPA